MHFGGETAHINRQPEKQDYWSSSIEKRRERPRRKEGDREQGDTIEEGKFQKRRFEVENMGKSFLTLRPKRGESQPLNQ